MITVKLEIGNKNKFREKVYRTCGLHSTLNRLILVLLSIINVHHVTNFERSLFKPTKPNRDCVLKSLNFKCEVA